MIALLVIENDVPDVDLAHVFQILVAAYQGDKERSDNLLTEYDKHFFGAMVLWQLANWCQCGFPWDLEATSKFAAKIKEANMSWPPQAPLTFPLKDW